MDIDVTYKCLIDGNLIGLAGLSLAIFGLLNPFLDVLFGTDRQNLMIGVKKQKNVGTKSYKMDQLLMMNIINSFVTVVCISTFISG